MKRRSTRGFTLIELLVVIAILSVVTTLASVTLVQLWARWGELQSATKLDRAAESVFAEMHEDFAAAVASPIAGVSLQGTSAKERDSRYFNQDLASDRFTLPVEVPTASGTATVLAGYQIERKDGQSMLVRTEKQLRGGAPSPGRVVADGVVQMRVEYAGAGGGWSESWAQPGNPRAVRVSLLLVGSNHPQREQIARQAVLTVNVP